MNLFLGLDELVFKKALPSASFGVLPKEGRPPEGRASSRRKGVLPKEGRPPEGRASSRRKGVLPKEGRPPEGRASSRRKGVLPKEGRPPEGRASFGVLRKASPLAASFGKLHLWREGRPSLP